MSDVERKLRALGIGRFQVMALLQAARYYVLSKDLNKAKSFGLNRAIFYAWAKYHGPHTYAWKRAKIEELIRRPTLDELRGKCPEGFVEVLGECIQVGPNGYYKIGGQEQTPRDFDVEILNKVKRIANPDKVWEIAIKYVSQFPDWVLRNPQRFYKLVYEPIRDRFFIDIARGVEPQPPKRIIERLRSIDRAYEEAKKKQKSLLDFTSKQS